MGESPGSQARGRFPRLHVEIKSSRLLGAYLCNRSNAIYVLAASLSVEEAAANRICILLERET